MYKRTLGTVVAVLGLLCVLGAAGLTIMNVRTDNKAAVSFSDFHIWQKK